MKKKLSTGFNPKQHMTKKDFEIFYYQDTIMKQVQEHYHNHYELYFYLDGDLSYEVDKKSYLLKKGDFLLIPPNIPHRPVFHSMAQPYRRIILWIHEDFMEQFQQISKDFSYGFSIPKETCLYRFHMDSVAFQDVEGRILEILEEVQMKRAFGELKSICLIAGLLVQLNRILYEQKNPECIKTGDVLYLKVCDYINTHLEEELSLDDLASFFYVSKYHICHTFKENMGISVHRYIIKKRLHKARNSILSGSPLGKVYLLNGFCDYTSFYRAFKKEFGLSPKEYVEIHKINHEADYLISPTEGK